MFKQQLIEVFWRDDHLHFHSKNNGHFSLAMNGDQLREFKNYLKKHLESGGSEDITWATSSFGVKVISDDRKTNICFQSGWIDFSFDVYFLPDLIRDL